MWHGGSMSFLFATVLALPLLGCCGRAVRFLARPLSCGQRRSRGFAVSWLFSPRQQALILLEHRTDCFAQPKATLIKPAFFAIQ